jgi:ComF family protein
MLVFQPYCCLCGLDGRVVAGREPGLTGRWHQIPFDLCEYCQAILPRPDRPWMFADDVLQFAYLRYARPVDKLIQQFKFSGDRSAGRTLAIGFGLARLTERDCPLPEAILPVPMHPRRLRERGYDHTRLIAHWVAEVCALPVLDHALVRCRATPAQSLVGAEARRLNVRGAFRLARPHDLAGLRHVALIDDVVTTGSTLGAATKALQQVGPIEVEHWVLARTELR